MPRRRARGFEINPGFNRSAACGQLLRRPRRQDRGLGRCWSTDGSIPAADTPACRGRFREGVRVPPQRALKVLLVPEPRGLTASQSRVWWAPGPRNTAGREPCRRRPPEKWWRGSRPSVTCRHALSRSSAAAAVRHARVPGPFGQMGARSRRGEASRLARGRYAWWSPTRAADVAALRGGSREPGSTCATSRRFRRVLDRAAAIRRRRPQASPPGAHGGGRARGNR